jgi:hypothetical protein
LVFLPERRPEVLAQGDVLESVEFFRPKAGTYKDTVWRPGIVVSHSCDVTKFSTDQERGRANLDRFPLLVAPVSPAADIADAGVRGHAKAGRVARYFHIPGDGPLDGDHFVDFWWIQPAAVLELLAITRLGSLSDDWQKYLQRALDRFFSWEDRKQLVPRP